MKLKTGFFAAAALAGLVQLGCSSSNNVSAITPITPGTQCPEGGLKVQNGDQTQVICNSGSQIVTTSTLAAGDTHCPSGGTAIEIGLDNGAGGGAAGDGKLQAGEITSTQYICNTGAVLTQDVTLPVGDANCPQGGDEIDVGFDNGAGGGTAADGILQAGEITSTRDVCATDGTEVGSFTPPAGAPGSSAINLSGGASDGGVGGASEGFYEYVYYGTNGGHLKTFTTGSVDASFVLPTMPAAPANITTISTDTVVSSQPDTSGAGLTAGAYFTSGQDSPLYYWDGTTATAVTDLAISSGATVTFSEWVNGGTPQGEIAVEIPGTFRNSGTITTDTLADGVSKSNLEVNVGDYWGDVGSTINLRGLDAAAGNNGGNGGNVEVYTGSEYAGGGIVNQGTVDTSGGSGDSGGNAGSVYIESDYSATLNTGNITALGGLGNVAAGGSGGPLTFYTYYADINNSGAIDTSGGNGAVTGGSAGNIDFETIYTGSSRNSGDLTFNGGDAASTCTTGCAGGSASTVEPDITGGDILNSGSLTGHGGDGAMGAGGSGGNYEPSSNQGEASTFGDEYSQKGSIEVSGNIDLHGGAGVASGGAGGEVDAYSELYYEVAGQEIAFYGYGQGLNLNGGDGALGGGAGGAFDVENAYSEYAQYSSYVYVPGGSVLNNVNVTSRGGNSATGAGGAGGYLYMATQDSYQFPAAIEWAINSGNFDLSGGDGATTGGLAGYLLMFGRNGVVNSGNITDNGGDATGAGGTGGSVNYYEDNETGLLSDQGAVTNSGNISMNGGNATGSGSAGGDSVPFLSLLGTSVQTTGNFSVNGGNAGDVGGAAGSININGTDGTSAVSGTQTATGGTATAPGTNGTVSIDGHVVAD